MANTTLRMGSKGSEVIALQNALNLALSPSPGLIPDGDFGLKTDRAVRTYQAQRRIRVDGVAGPVTRCVLRGAPRRPLPTIHPVRRIPQPSPSTCWAAAAAMMKDLTPQQIIDRTPAHLTSSSGGTLSFSDTADNVGGNREFADAHGLDYHPPQIWSVSGLKGLVTRSPVMISLLWNVGEYTAGYGSSGHRVVVFGIDTDNDPTGLGTLLHIHDPWAPNVGKTFQKNYFALVNETSCFNYGVFSR